MEPNRTTYAGRCAEMFGVLEDFIKAIPNFEKIGLEELKLELARRELLAPELGSELHRKAYPEYYTPEAEKKRRESYIELFDFLITEQLEAQWRLKTQS